MGTTSSCLKVEERQPSYYSLALVIDRHERGEESLRLYRAGARTYEAVLANKSCSPMCFSLFRLEDEAIAREKFRYLYERLSPFYQTSKRCFKAEVLQSLMDTLEENPDWSLAHVATQVGLTECLENSEVVQSLDSKQHDKQWTPLHLAAKIGKTEVVRKLLEFDPKLLVSDTLGNTPLHYAAQVSPDILLAMIKKTIISAGGEQQIKEIVNAKNGKGESPLHVACQYSQDKGVKVLLESGAEVDAQGYAYPIHTAIKSNSLQCAAAVLEFHPEQLEIRDTKYGGTPLHWVRNRECIEMLVERGADLEALNNEGETPLHIMVRCGRLECIISLLAQGAYINSKGKKASTPLHVAVECDNLDIVHALIVFGADIDALNASHQSPRHLASSGIKIRGKDIARALCLVGAAPCDLKRIRCTTECGRPFKEDFKVGPPSSSLHTVFPSYEEALGLLALAASWRRGRGVDRVDYGGRVREEMSIFRSLCGKDAVLCMDGGGIRGLILIQLLLAVEDVTGQPTAQLFDWIAGTSTGGILALAIAHGKSVRYCQGLYFNMKNRVFKGMRPYDSEPLESFLRNEFGESTVMSSIIHPKVAVTSILADRRPAVLHLFRTYNNPASDCVNSSYKAPPKPADQKIWRAARGTGAAPSYFRAMGRILDGGLIANNPTLDMLTEIHNYNRYLIEQGRRPRELGLVLSLGTGVPPEESVKSIDVFKPEGIMDTAMAAMGARSLGNLLIDQVTASNGAVVERAKAWCEMIKTPFFRFTTPMSSDVGLDEIDDRILVKMLWEAQAYIYKHRSEFDRLGQLLIEAS